MLEKLGLPDKPSLRGNNWVVDSSHCQGCSSQFTIITRKHHCRRCGGLFCNSCTQQRMALRGQGEAPVRICDPCKKIEEATRFERRYGSKNKVGKGDSKPSSHNEDEILNEILGDSVKESVLSRRGTKSNLPSNIQKGSSSASFSNAEDILRSVSFDSINQVGSGMGSSTPDELRQQAIDEKTKYKLLKSEGKSEEALKAFKRSKEFERQATAMEINLRKSRKTLSSSNTMEAVNSQNDLKDSDKKIITRAPKVGKDKDDLAAELKELGWSDKDLHDEIKKPASTSLEGELFSLIGESSKTSSKDKSVIDKSEVTAIKKNALKLKREGKLSEAKEELKRAKILEKQLEEQEFLADAEESDDEISLLIKNMSDDDDKHDLLIDKVPNTDFDFSHLVRIDEDIGVDSNFEVTDEDMYDPDIAAALNSFGWTEDPKDPDVNVITPNRVDREALLNEIQSLKRDALSKKRAGNTAEALTLLKKAKLLERDLESHDSQVTTTSVTVEQPLMAAPRVSAKSKAMIQRELLGIKKKALALRREGKLDEAEEELKKGKALEQQLEEMENSSKVKIVTKQSDISLTMDLEGDDEKDEDITDQDLHDPAYLSLLKNLGWNDEDNDVATVQSKPFKKSDSLSMGTIGSVSIPTVNQASSFARVGGSKRSKGELQRELLGMKRKALALRRQGQIDEADEVLNSAKALEDQIAAFDAPKTENPVEIMNPYNTEPIQFDAKIDQTPLMDYTTEEQDNPRPVFVNPSSVLISNTDIIVQKEKSISNIMVKPLASQGHRADPVLGWNDEDNDDATVQSKPLKKSDILSTDTIDSVSIATINQPSSFTRVGDSKRSKGELQRELLGMKRKALALRRQGQIDEADEVLNSAKTIEDQIAALDAPKIENPVEIISSNNTNPIQFNAKIDQGPLMDYPTMEQDNPHPVLIKPSKVVISDTNNALNVTVKPLTSRDRFKMQQKSLAHKRQSLKLRREGRIEEADTEFKLAKDIETQLEEAAGSVKPAVTGAEEPGENLGIDDFLDPQLLSALRAIGVEDTNLVSQKTKTEIPPVISMVDSEQFNQEKTQLEAEIKAEKVKAVNLKRSGKKAEALDALRRAKVLEKKLGSLNS